MEPRWLSHLMEPRAYPQGTGSVELVQTHISWVFITDNLVFKVKKPVDFGFLDFTTLEKRRHYCEEEVRLNRRLCPAIYKGVWAIVEQDGGYVLVEAPGDREVVEWAVAMERMPTDGLMTALIQEGRLTTSHLDRVVSRLVPFYKEADGEPEVVRHGTLEAVKFNTDENFQQTEEFVGGLISRDHFQHIQDFTQWFYSDKGELFAARIEAGMVRDCHGDLYSANICFDEDGGEVYIFDCIEFNRRFRCGDVASDAAFLAMDLDFHGMPHYSARFTEELASGLGDSGMAEVLDFYKCYRAYVRGKIGCFTWASPGIGEEAKERAARDAKRYFRLALRYAGGLSGRPCLYLFIGPSGTGKSTVAQAFASRKGLPVFNSDRVRKEAVAGLSATEKRTEPLGQGIYSKEMTERTYRLLHQAAGRRLVVGEDAVIDATYTSSGTRREAAELASAAGADLRVFLCHAPEEVVKTRLEARAQEESVSDGRWEIYLAQRGNFDHVPEFPALQRIDTSRELSAVLEAIGP